MKRRLYLLIVICLLPLTGMMVYLLALMNSVSQRYDAVVEDMTLANTYNLVFKEDMDYLMYIIVVNAERAGQLVDTEKPQAMIAEARDSFYELYGRADTDSSRESLRRIIKSLNILEDRVTEIKDNALVSGSYDENMKRLDLNVRVLTDLIQEQIQKYIYEQAVKMEKLRVGIREDVVHSITAGRSGSRDICGSFFCGRKSNQQHYEANPEAVRGGKAGRPGGFSGTGSRSRDL